MNITHEYEMGWYGRPIAKIVNNGVAWNFSFNEGWMLPLSNGKPRAGMIPAFIQNLFPEGYMHEVLNTSDATGLTVEILNRSERYLSNIAIVQDPQRLKHIPLDILGRRLCTVSDAHGVYEGELKDMPNTSKDFIEELNSLLARTNTPRFSGNQPKIPCHLDDDGRLSPASDKPFTHILKIAGVQNDPHHLRGVVEWGSMSLAKAAGVQVCDFALIEMDSGALGYVCERFDIPQGEDDMRMIYAEDFCSVFNKSSVYRFGMEWLEMLAEHYKQMVPDSPKDDEQMFLQVFTNYLLENADFHLKNASVIRVASPTLDTFRSTHLAPAYDIMNTRYFTARGSQLSAEQTEDMCMGWKGKKNGLERQDFREFAEALGLSAQRANELMHSAAHGIAQRAAEIQESLPRMVQQRARAAATVRDMCERAVFMCNRLFPDIEPLCRAEELGRHFQDLQGPDGDEPRQPRTCRISSP